MEFNKKELVGHNIQLSITLLVYIVIAFIEKAMDILSIKLFINYQTSIVIILFYLLFILGLLVMFFSFFNLENHEKISNIVNIFKKFSLLYSILFFIIFLFAFDLFFKSNILWDKDFYIREIRFGHIIVFGIITFIILSILKRVNELQKNNREKEWQDKEQNEQIIELEDKINQLYKEIKNK